MRILAAREATWPLPPALSRARDGCAELGTGRALRQQFDTLGAADPAHDPEGCIAAFEALAAHLRSRHAGALRTWRAPPPERVLELRGLQPPEPIVRIFEALERSPGEPLRAILPHEPAPLYALLRERGFRYSGTQRADVGSSSLIDRRLSSARVAKSGCTVRAFHLAR